MRYKVGAEGRHEETPYPMSRSAPMTYAPNSIGHAVRVDDDRPACGTTVALNDFPHLDWETWSSTRKCLACRDAIRPAESPYENSPAHIHDAVAPDPNWAEHVGPRRMGMP